jgi:hypothetical protein
MPIANLMPQPEESAPAAGPKDPQTHPIHRK